MQRCLTILLLSMSVPLLTSCRKSIDDGGRAGPATTTAPIGLATPTGNGPAAAVDTDDPITILRKLGAEIQQTDGQDVTSITLAKSNVTDDDLAHLADMGSLDTLNLFRTEVTDAGLVHVEKLTGLRYLVLAETGVTDEGLKHVAGLADLQTLDLEGTRVTDAGLAHLKSLENLTFLNLTATRVTELGVEELQEALPGVSIER